MGHARNFRELKVWKDSVEYCTSIYSLCSTMPWFEKKGLGDQLQRASVSIPSNIAEGAGRSSDAEFAHFLDNALGSAYEVETQLQIAKNVKYIPDDIFNEMNGRVVDIERQLYALIRTIRTNTNSKPKE